MVKPTATCMGLAMFIAKSRDLCDKTLSSLGFFSEFYGSTFSAAQLCPVTLKDVCSRSASIKKFVCQKRTEDSLFCDVSNPPLHGKVGMCTRKLFHGESCNPQCNVGFYLFRPATCLNGVLIPALCIIKAELKKNQIRIISVDYSDQTKGMILILIKNPWIILLVKKIGITLYFALEKSRPKKKFRVLVWHGPKFGHGERDEHLAKDQWQVGDILTFLDFKDKMDKNKNNLQPHYYHYNIHRDEVLNESKKEEVITSTTKKRTTKMSSKAVLDFKNV